MNKLVKKVLADAPDISIGDNLIEEQKRLALAIAKTIIERELTIKELRNVLALVNSFLEEDTVVQLCQEKQDRRLGIR